MLRLLLGAAAVAAIAFVGYFFWGEYSRWSDAAEAERLEQTRLTKQLTANAQCEDHIMTLRKEAADPGSLTVEEKEAAVEGYLACR